MARLRRPTTSSTRRATSSSSPTTGSRRSRASCPGTPTCCCGAGQPGFVVAVLDAAAPARAPEGVGLALRRAVDRLYDVTLSGEEVDHPAVDQVSPEWVHGPAVTDLGLLIAVDLDGARFSTAMLETMVHVIVEELRTADAHTILSAPLDLDRHTPRREPRAEEADTG